MKNIIQSILSHIINTYLIQCLNFLDLFVRVSWSKWDIRSPCNINDMLSKKVMEDSYIHQEQQKIFNIYIQSLRTAATFK